MKNLLVLILFIFITQNSTAQKEAAIWYFGDNAGLDFNSGTPVALTNGKLSTIEGCSTISDVNGNLLFYTDGITVWNRFHNTMPNGTGLLGHPSSTQSGIIVPQPGNPNIYYIFTVDQGGEAAGMQYNIVDMTADGGFGDVTTKNVLMRTPVLEKLTAVSHTNGTDIWVIAHIYGTDEFLTYLVRPTGLNTTPVISNTGLVLPVDLDNGRGTRGYMKASPDGNFLAVVTSVEGLELFRFDSNTGLVSNPVLLDTAFPSGTNSSVSLNYGVEFSSDSSKLYVTSDVLFLPKLDPNSTIYQFDISTYNQTAILGSVVQLFTRQAIEIGALQLAIDGKIYVTQANQTYLGVINNPNIAGFGANYVENAVSLGGKEGTFGLPPFIQTYFVVGLLANNFCHGDATSFSVNTSEPITNIIWNFGDGNTATLETPSHTYTTTGTYTVSVTVSTSSETKTETKEIIIYENPVANTATKFEVCSINPNHTFDLSTKDIEILGTQLPVEYTLRYYPSLIDAQDGTNPLTTLYTNTNTTETVYARISNNANASCFDITSFDLEVKLAPVLNTVINWVVCDTDTDGFYNFNLTTKNNEILNGQSAATFTINYFESQANADLNTNVIGPTYINTSSPQDLFFRIENTLSPECFETGSFSIAVITEVLALQPTNIEVCDDDNDSFFTFNLINQDTQILDGQSATNFSVSYHASQLDADNRVNALSTTNYINAIANRETLYARVENNANTTCYNTTSFDLVVHDSPVIQTVTKWQICDDNNDGLQSFNLTEKDMEVLGNQSATDFSVSYYQNQVDATTDQNAITGIFQNTTVNTQNIFYRIENNANASCFITSSFVLEVFDTPLANIPEPIIVCDTNETGIQTVDFVSKDIEILNGQDANVYSISYHKTETEATTNQNSLPKQGYSNTNLQETIYVRIQNNQLETCFTITAFQFLINPLPQPILEERYVICPDNPELEIDGGDFESWSWQDENKNEIHSDRIINILNIGEYSLAVTHTLNGVVCEKTIDFEVVSSGAPETFTVDTSGFSDRIAIVINAMGIGDFEYSVDGENFQTSNEFEVFPGEYTIYVRDPFLCRTITENIFVLGYQKFFTPNGDNINEHWTVIGAENYPESEISIYDRYGKLVKQMSPTDKGWDGMYNGIPLPSSDYWFKYVYGAGKVYTGHFTLKR